MIYALVCISFRNHVSPWSSANNYFEMDVRISLEQRNEQVRTALLAFLRIPATVQIPPHELLSIFEKQSQDHYQLRLREHHGELMEKLAHSRSAARNDIAQVIYVASRDS